MPTAWNGADPTLNADPGDYELGAEYLANSDITVTHLRIWVPETETNVVNRRGRIWSTAGAQLSVVTLPDDLPTGWSTHALSTPLERLAGTRFVVSYSTGGNYGVLSGGLDNNVNSADGAVTALGFANATGGFNGKFNGSPGIFPDTGFSSHAFYGTDFQYLLGVGGNTAPEITSLTVVAASATVTATVVATDNETLVGATYRYEWGDGASTSSGSSSANHTYTVSGDYAVLVSVTDVGGLSDYAAKPIRVTVPTGVAGSTLVKFKQALKTILAARSALSAVQVTYEYPNAGITGEDIWLGNAESDNNIPVMRAGTKKVDESYALTVFVQVLKMKGEGQEAADLRATALFAEVQQQLAETPQLISEIMWAQIAGWEHFVGPFEGGGASRGSRFEIKVNVRARLFL